MILKTSKLGEVCKIQSGNSIPAKEKDSLYRNINEGLPYIATKDISIDRSINYENGVKIPSKFYNKFRLSKKDSVLLCAEGGSAGKKIAYSNKDCHFVNKLFSIKPKDEIDAKYIYYYTLSSEFQNKFKESMHGLIGGVSLSKIKDFKITYPPLAEQKVIVAKLNTVYAEINKIIHLTKEKRIKEKDIKLSILKSIFSITKTQKTIGDIATVIAGQSPEGKYYNKDAKGTPFYQGKKEFGDYELKEPTVWTTKTTKEALKGDILLSVRAPVGETNMSHDKICIGRGLAAIRANKGNNSEFIYFFLNSIKDQIVGNTGAVFNSINKKQIEDIIIPVPDFNKQNIIVNKIKLILSHIKEINLSTKQKLHHLSILKSSILKHELTIK